MEVVLEVRILEARNDGERVTDAALRDDLQEPVHLDVMRFRLELQGFAHGIVLGHHARFVKDCCGGRRSIFDDLALRDAFMFEGVPRRLHLLLLLGDARTQKGELLFRILEFRCGVRQLADRTLPCARRHEEIIHPLVLENALLLR